VPDASHDPDRMADGVRPGRPLTRPEPTAVSAVDPGRRARRRDLVSLGVTLAAIGAFFLVAALIALWGPEWGVLARWRRVYLGWDNLLGAAIGVASLLLGLVCLLHALRTRKTWLTLALAVVLGVLSLNASVFGFFASNTGLATSMPLMVASVGATVATLLYRHNATLPDHPDATRQAGQVATPAATAAPPPRRRMPGWAVAVIATIAAIGTCVATGFLAPGFVDRHTAQVQGLSNFFSLGRDQAPSLRGALGGSRPILKVSEYYAIGAPGSCLIVRYRGSDVSPADAAAYGAYFVGDGFKKRTDVSTSSPGEVYSRGNLLVQFGDVDDAFRLALYDTDPSRCPYT